MVLNFVKDNIALEYCLAFMTKIKFRFIFLENIVNIVNTVNTVKKQNKNWYGNLYKKANR